MTGISSPLLLVTAHSTMRKLRKVPSNGTLLVHSGDEVLSDTPVARAALSGRVHSIGAAAALGISRGRLGHYVSVTEGDAVREGQVLASSRSLFGLFKSEVRSPADGTVESVSNISGHILIREKPEQRDILAFVPGKVIHADESRGVEIESDCSAVQGVFGIGKEVLGTLVKAEQGTDGVLSASHGAASIRDRIAFTSGSLTLAALEALRDGGAQGVVAASLDGGDLNRLIGRDVNFASTGDENIGFTLMITEGFGKLQMAPRTAEVLDQLCGSPVSMCGVTQVRAGVIRPEIIGPPIGEPEAERDASAEIGSGDAVRIVRGERFGMQGTIVDIPTNPVKVSSGTRALIYRVLLNDGTTVEVPRANVER